MKILTVCISLLLLSCSDDSLSLVCPRKCYAVPDVSPYTYYYSEKELLKTKNVGVCREGYSVCDENFNIVECKGEVLPSVEVCDGLDNDCDGIIDDNISINRWSPDYPCLLYGECATSSVSCINSVLVCNYPNTVEFPNETRCDGRDNDCDGRIDEDLYVGQYCYEGPAGTEWNVPCHPGALRCLDGNTVCDNQELPKIEVCDGVDNDCNGVIDDSAGVLLEKYDIVFIVDTSGSMCPYISAVSGALDSYAQQFDGNQNYRFSLVIMSYLPAPYVRVDTDFTDFANIRNRLLSLGCNGGGAEASLESMLYVCDENNPLNLSWRSNANALFFVFTDEPAQTYVDSSGVWCFGFLCGSTTEQNVVDSCLQSTTLPFIWGRNNDAKFQYITQNANGLYFNLVSDWRQIFDDMNSIIVSLCIASAP